jgi:thiol-disulfide isomerase/thioredoxin
MTTIVPALALALTLAAASPAPPPPATHVLMINGGGNRLENYSSHLAHLRQLHGLLTRAGIPAERISVFNADGGDPAPDMCVAVPEPSDGVFLGGTQIGQALGRSSLAFESSALPGVKAQPSTRPNIERWFGAARGRLRPGDTLLLYVTDHGTEDPRDHSENKIVLWGQKETLSVRQLRALIGRLDPRVRVVSLMSQCFSGGFARLAFDDKPGSLPGGSVCGYFASTADRPAYGCYPMVAGREGVGHSFEFMETLARTGRFTDAHAAVLTGDTTPDVPLRTSEVYLQELVARAGRAAQPPVETDQLVDRLLREAWKDRARWEPEIRLLDGIGRTFGLPSPRSLGELEASRKRIAELAKQLDSQGADWAQIKDIAAASNERRLRAARPEWKSKASPASVQALTADGRRALAAAAAAALAENARAEGRADRFATISARAGLADEASYRMEVRQAALLRMRTVLTTIAGRVHLDTRGTPAERNAFAGLRKCEDLSLPKAPEPAAAARPTPSFPPLDDELKVVQQVIPGWMGIQFDDRPSPRRARLKLGEGAALVTNVFPGSPAQAAGLSVGDVVLGPPGQPFTQQGDIKAWTMLLPVDRPHPIELLREGTKLILSLTPRLRPVELPKIGPPKPSTPAPPVRGSLYRGTPLAKLTAKGPYLLIFWATWCGPCKESLPEAMAFARARRLPIIAVTDEGREELDTFFKHWKRPFPDNVVSDEDRLTFAGFGVSGTPTFVLVDDARLVRGHAVGYSRDRGLPLDGWRWDGR